MIHIIFTFPIVMKILNLTNVPLLRLCTIAMIIIFAVIYGI